MIIETERIILREMTQDDFDALYRVLGDSDIMRHYPYTFDEKRVMNWIKQNNQTTTSNFPCNFNFAVSNMNRFNQGIYHG